VDEPYELNDEEFAAVVALEGRQRFEHVLKRICDTERAYVLADGDDLVVLRDEDGEAAPQLPLWPHERFADEYRRKAGGAGHAEIELTELVEELLPELAADGVEIAIMPTEAAGNVPTIAADELRRAVISYHDEWYGGWPKYERLDEIYPPRQ
jgi:Protein of unknown function (DUF2750)